MSKKIDRGLAGGAIGSAAAAIGATAGAASTVDGAVIDTAVIGAATAAAGPSVRAIKTETEEMTPWLVEVRRALHQIPEPGNEENETADFLCKTLASLHIPFERHGTAIVALVQGDRPGRVIGLRADIDGLPLMEPEGLPFVSRHKGYMHACGHDAHMATALGTAKYFAAHTGELAGAVKLLFQPAEETTGGAEPMIARGCLEKPHVDAIVGLHVMPYLQTGRIELKHGALNGASDYLRVVVRGKSGHAAYPETAVDAVMIAGKVLDALHTVVSRTVSPLEEAVVTIGTIEGGTKNNIIADEVKMTGTIRTTNPQVRASVAHAVSTIATALPKVFGGSGEAEIIPGYTALINHDWVVDRLAAVAKNFIGADAIQWKEKPSLGVEDFSFFLRKTPGAFYHLGCGRAGGANAPLHSRDFAIDEACLPLGVRLNVGLVYSLLAGGEEKNDARL